MLIRCIESIYIHVNIFSLYPNLSFICLCLQEGRIGTIGSYIAIFRAYFILKFLFICAHSKNNKRNWGKNCTCWIDCEWLGAEGASLKDTISLRHIIVKGFKTGMVK